MAVREVELVPEREDEVQEVDDVIERLVELKDVLLSEVELNVLVALEEVREMEVLDSELVVHDKLELVSDKLDVLLESELVDSDMVLCVRVALEDV